MKARLIISAAIMIVPTIVAAQRGMGGAGGRRGIGGRGESDNQSAKPNQLKSDDIEKLNPAKILLDKRKALKIDGAQEARLETIASRYAWNTRVFVSVVDSLQGVPGGPKGSAFAEALQSVRQEFDTASARSLGVMTETQRPEATKLIEKPTDEIESQLAVVGRGRPAGRAPGMKPPD